MRHFFREFFLNIVLGCVSAIFIVFSMLTILHFVTASADFTVVSTRLVCEQPLNNRCATHYQVVETNDKNLIDYMPFFDDFSSEDLVIGSHLEKDRFSINYKKDGIIKNWQYWHGRRIKFLIGLAGFLARYLLLKLGYIKGGFFKQLILHNKS